MQNSKYKLSNKLSQISIKLPVWTLIYATKLQALIGSLLIYVCCADKKSWNFSMFYLSAKQMFQVNQSQFRTSTQPAIIHVVSCNRNLSLYAHQILQQLNCIVAAARNFIVQSKQFSFGASLIACPHDVEATQNLLMLGGRQKPQQNCFENKQVRSKHLLPVKSQFLNFKTSLTKHAQLPWNKKCCEEDRDYSLLLWRQIPSIHLPVQM